MDHDELFDGWERAWSGRDPSAFGPLCAPDVHYEDPLTDGPLRGAAALGDARPAPVGGVPRRARSSAPASAWPTPRSSLAAPCRVLGTHRGALAGFPATGRSLDGARRLLVRARGRAAAAVRAFFDVYGAAVQLGLLPRRRTLGERALLLLRGFGLRARG